MVVQRIVPILGRLSLLAVALGVDVTPASAQQPAPPAPAAVSPRRGGLLPQRTESSERTLITREELVRKFDLDGNGRIDEAEADVARSRMRRERAEMQPRSIIDPLTGRPRGLETPESQPPGSRTLPDEEEGPLLVPGRPDAAPPTAARAKPSPAAKSAAEQPKPRDLNAAVRDPATGTRVAPNALRPPVVTGGVRAGGLPVRPGYGSGLPKSDLNAARQPGGLPSSQGIPGMRGQQRLGSQPLPNGFPPYGRGIPPAPGNPASRAAPQRPNLLPRSEPRVSAEDIGR